MIGARIGFVVFLVAFLIETGSAQHPPPQKLPNVNLLIHGSVGAVDPQIDGGLVIGGDFAVVNGVERSNLARLRPDGTLDPQWNPGADEGVGVIAHDASGNLYVAGNFSRIGGLPRSGLAKLDANGTVDSVWSPSPNGSVEALLVDGDWLYVGGSFYGIDGKGGYGLARVSLHGSGQVDETWTPSPDGTVTGFAMDESSLFIAGYFTQVNGIGRSGVAKLSKVGPGLVDEAWSVLLDFGYAQTIAHDGKGSLYIGGPFSSMNGLPRQRLAKVSSNGPAVVDPDWNPSADNSVYSISLGADGDVYVGGWFQYVGGMQRRGAAKLNPDGTGSADPNWNAQIDSHVYDLVADGDSVHIAGIFTAAGGRSGWGVATLDGTGSAQAPDNQVARKGGYARAFLRQSNGGLIVGGWFRAANHLSRHNLLRITPEGVLDESWNPQANGTVWALAEAVDGGVIIGGGFTQVGEISRNYIARVMGAGSGEVDSTWNPAANGSVAALITNEAGELYAGGLFTSIGGVARQRIAKLSSIGTGTVDPLWNPDPDSSILALERGPAGTIFVGGWFTSIGGAERRLVARLDGGGIGAADPSWNPGLEGVFVDHLALDPAGWLYLAGGFHAAGGLPLRELVKVSASTGHIVHSWDAGLQNSVDALAVDTLTGDVFVSGSFESIAGVPRYRIAKLLAGDNAIADPEWSPGPSGPTLFRVHALLVDAAEASVYVSGPFDRIGGHPRLGFARLYTDANMIFADGFE